MRHRPPQRGTRSASLKPQGLRTVQTLPLRCRKQQPAAWHLRASSSSFASVSSRRLRRSLSALKRKPVEFAKRPCPNRPRRRMRRRLRTRHLKPCRRLLQSMSEGAGPACARGAVGQYAEAPQRTPVELCSYVALELREGEVAGRPAHNDPPCGPPSGGSPAQPRYWPSGRRRPSAGSPSPTARARRLRGRLLRRLIL
jgi:hypothetical protein